MHLLTELLRLLLQILLLRLLLGTLRLGIVAHLLELAIDVLLALGELLGLLAGFARVALGHLPHLLRRLLAGLTGLRQRAGLHLVGCLLGGAGGLLSLLRLLGLLPVLLGLLLGQLLRVPGDVGLLLGQVANRVLLRLLALGRLLLVHRSLHGVAEIALLLGELASLLRLSTVRQT